MSDGDGTTDNDSPSDIHPTANQMSALRATHRTSSAPAVRTEIDSADTAAPLPRKTSKSTAQKKPWLGKPAMQQYPQYAIDRKRESIMILPTMALNLDHFFRSSLSKPGINFKMTKSAIQIPHHGAMQIF
jgi:hypothetical protein